MNPTFDTLLFDLDGTLTDPGLGITNSVRHSLAHFGIEEPERARLYPFIGPPLKESFMRFYGFDSAKADEACLRYREYFSVTGLFENEVFPDIPPLLESLAARGRALYIATSKPAVFARRIAAHFDLERYFTAIEGSELDGTRTNKAELITHILEKHSLNPERCLMIGDREHDIKGATANGLASIGVGYGYGSEEELRSAGASWYVEDVKALGALLEEVG